MVPTPLKVDTLGSLKISIPPPFLLQWVLGLGYGS